MSQQQLVPGEILQLIPAHGGTAAEGIVDAVEAATLTLRAPNANFRQGDLIRLQQVVPEDARYTVDAIVDTAEPPRLVLRLLTEWGRVQQREYVRLRLHAKVYADLQPDAVDGARRAIDLKARVIDLSAGGMQLETESQLELGTRVFVRFELPPAQLVATTGLVVRRGRPVKSGHRAGVRFMGLAPALETVILRWIYAQQAAKRRRTLS